MGRKGARDDHDWRCMAIWNLEVKSGKRVVKEFAVTWDKVWRRTEMHCKMKRGWRCKRSQDAWIDHSVVHGSVHSGTCFSVPYRCMYEPQCCDEEGYILGGAAGTREIGERFDDSSFKRRQRGFNWREMEMEKEELKSLCLSREFKWMKHEQNK